MARGYLSADYRQDCALESFTRAQQQNIKQYGVLQEIALKENDPFQSSFNLFSWKKYYQGGLIYRGQKREYWVNWEVVEEDGDFKIDATYLTEHEGRVPGIY